MRSRTLAARAPASSLPRIASPRMLTLMRKPSPVRRRTYFENVGSSEARMTSAVSLEIRQSTAFSVMAGIVGATLPSVARPKRSKPPRAAGTPSAVRSCKRSAERFASRMRSTWSVRSSSRSRPASSASNRASRLDEAASLREVSPSDASRRARARASALAVRTSSAGRPELLVVLAESRVGALMVEAFPRSGALSCATVAPWLSN